MTYFSGAGGTLMTTLKILVILSPFLLIFAFVIIRIKNKLLYKYKVRIFKVRENGKVKELNTVGGYIGRKNSAPFFRIKIGRFWWQIKDLTTTPNPKYMDEDDRFYYFQNDIDTYIQVRRDFNPKGVEYSPVESDVKYGAILSIQRIKEVLRVESTWKKLAPYVTLVLLSVIFLVAYAMLMNKCSG